MDNIPNTVDVRDLVGEKFNRVKKGRDADDPPVVEHIQTTGKLCETEFLQQTENRDRSVQIYPRGPGRTERQGQSRKPFHRNSPVNGVYGRNKN